MFLIGSRYFQNSTRGIDVYDKQTNFIGFLYGVYQRNVYKVGINNSFRPDEIKSLLKKTHYIINSDLMEIDKKELDCAILMRTANITSYKTTIYTTTNRLVDMEVVVNENFSLSVYYYDSINKYAVYDSFYRDLTIDKVVDSIEKENRELNV